MKEKLSTIKRAKNQRKIFIHEVIHNIHKEGPQVWYEKNGCQVRKFVLLFLINLSKNDKNRNVLLDTMF